MLVRPTASPARHLHHVHELGVGIVESAGDGDECKVIDNESYC